eukprot:s3_g57.t1
MWKSSFLLFILFFLFCMVFLIFLEGGSSKKEEKRKAKEAEKKAKEEEKKRKEEEALAAKNAKFMGPNLDFKNFQERAFGNVFIQSQCHTDRQWTNVGALKPEMKDSMVWIRARVHNTRKQGNKLCFLTLRQDVATVQAVTFGQDIAGFSGTLPDESVVDVFGKVACPEAPIVSCTVQNVELSVEKIFCVGRSQALPLRLADASRSEAELEKDPSLPTVGQDVRLDNRIIDLRTVANQAIFRLQSGVCMLFREFLLQNDFQEIHTPKLIGGASEGGSVDSRMRCRSPSTSDLSPSQQVLSRRDHFGPGFAGMALFQQPISGAGPSARGHRARGRAVPVPGIPPRRGHGQRPALSGDPVGCGGEGFLEEVANYVESNMSNDADKVTVTTLYNVQLAEMDLENAARDFSDAVEVSLRCSAAHENLGPCCSGEVFLFFMNSDWPIRGLLTWRRSTAVATFKDLELAGHPGSGNRGEAEYCGRRLLDQTRTENALPGGDRPVPGALLRDVRAKLRAAATFQTAFVQGSSSRGTSVDDMGGLAPWKDDWGQDCASDIDFVLLFTVAEPSPGAFEELWKMTEEHLAGWVMDPGVPVTVSRGRFGLVASLSEDLQIEVDLIPAISDPQGGHWILDSVSGKAPLPRRLDAAFHQALRALHAQRDASPAPAPWTGCPVAEYLAEDVARRHGAVEELEKATGELATAEGRRRWATGAVPPNAAAVAAQRPFDEYVAWQRKRPFQEAGRRWQERKLRVSGRASAAPENSAKADVFRVDYFEGNAYLAQSPQLYKQMALMTDMPRVFEVGPIFRSEKSFTHRHMTEFTGLDIEMTFKDHYHEVLDVLDGLFNHIFKGLTERFAREIEAVKTQYPFEDLKWKNPCLRLKCGQQIEIRESTCRYVFLCPSLHSMLPATKGTAALNASLTALPLEHFLELPPLRCTWRTQQSSGSSSPSEPTRRSVDSEMPISWISDHTEIRRLTRTTIEPWNGLNPPWEVTYVGRWDAESWESPKSLNCLRVFPGTAMVIEGSPSSWASSDTEAVDPEESSASGAPEGVTCRHPPRRPVKSVKSVKVAWPEGVTKPQPPKRPVIQAAVRQALRWAQKADGVWTLTKK